MFTLFLNITNKLKKNEFTAQNTAPLCVCVIFVMNLFLCKYFKILGC